MATFTYTPTIGASVDYKPNVRSARFGDGYEQRLAFGINTRPEIWNLEFRGKTTAQATEIDAFLKARNAVEAFDWTTPTGTIGKFICRSWSRSIDEPNIESIRAQFEQVFDQA
jgi:phage-related protein